MIIDKQNLLEAGACETGADEAEVICNFPREYNESITLCRDADRNDLAAWMLFFKGNIIKTTIGWTNDKYRAKDINNNDVWIEVKTEEELFELVSDIRDQNIELNPDLFNAYLCIPQTEGELWKSVDLSTTNANGPFEVYNFETAQYERFTNLPDAQEFQELKKEQYKPTIVVHQNAYVLSADKTEGTWMFINYAKPVN